MATIGFHISQMNSTDEVYIDWAVIGFHKFYPIQVWNADTSKFEEGEDADLVQVYRSNVRERTPAWKLHSDPVNNYRIKFTDKDFGRIQTEEQLAAFCVNELDKLDGMRVVENDEDEIEFAAGDRTKLATYDIREAQKKVIAPVEK